MKYLGTKYKKYIKQGRIQDFKLGGGALKKIAPSGGRRENFWGISCEKSRFYAKKSYFFPILGGEGGAGCALLGSAPDIRTLSVNIKFICTSFRNRQNRETLASFSGLFRSEYK